MTNFDSFKNPVIHFATKVSELPIPKASKPVKAGHVCNRECERKYLVEAHTNTKMKMRAVRLRKLHGKRPALRRTITK